MLTLKRLKECLHYDPDSGIFTRRIITGPRAHIGDIAGNKRPDGYIRITLDGKKYYANVLAWFYVTRKWPERDVDHKNGIRDDNKFRNLRHVSKSINSQNQRKAKINNRTGLLGVGRHGRRFHARININGKKIHLGSFRSPKLAHAAYLAAKRKWHVGCTI
jgi:hypothetical protein